MPEDQACVLIVIMFQKIQTTDIPNAKFYDIYLSNNSANKTVYFIGPYGGKMIYFRRFFKKTVAKGYRIVFLQPDKDILDASNPRRLEGAIIEAQDFIRHDRGKVKRDSDYLVGVSLGSYLGLNVQLSESFTKFLVVAGGAPIVNVFKSHYLFRSQRKKLKNSVGFTYINTHWAPFDEAFKSHEMDHLNVLAINSKKDMVIPTKYLSRFMKELTRAGAKVDNQQKGYLPHELEALSLNWRIGQVTKFFAEDA